MGDDRSAGALLEQLYVVRDQINEAVHRLRQASPDQFVATLSNVRTASLGVLRAYTEFVELLDVKIQSADSQDPHLLTAMKQIQDTLEKLTEVTVSAGQDQANIDDLRRGETGW